MNNNNFNSIFNNYNNYNNNNNNNNNNYNNNNNNNNNMVRNQNMSAIFNNIYSMFQNNPIFSSLIDFNSSRNFMDILEEIQSNNNHPVSEEILQQLPEIDVDLSKLDDDNKNCVICLQDFQNGEKATFLPCFHIFHTECIKNWLQNENTCPICKFKLTLDNLNGQGEGE
jgi:hypothetical protein